MQHQPEARLHVQVLLDQNALAKESGTEYMAVGEVSVSSIPPNQPHN